MAMKPTKEVALDMTIGFFIGLFIVVLLLAIAPSISKSKCNEIRLLSGLETEYSRGVCTIVLNEDTELDVKDYVQWLKLDETIITD